jgi:hypothetical protein|tara:strand:- start:3324 stop:3611 length:288 start_codon:yes stop_codon:yes gene_type:complete
MQLKLPGVSDTLQERGKDYGSFSGGIQIEADIIKLLTERYKKERGKVMDPICVQWLNHIAIKLSRLSITPNHVDSWHDIAGYATLIEKELTDAES